MAFRARLSAAPLKHSVRGLGTTVRPSFPRSIERGPVEAMPVLSAASRLHCFPRSIERGPVEASLATGFIECPIHLSALD